MKIDVLKSSQILAFLIGTPFTVYNLFSFKNDKFGYYFHDDNQIWLAVGITFLTIGYFIRNWKKL
ncbi:MAG: hypothetical protein OEY29_14310 [Gammaproteobacteria bacterium]|nr:hypothetical protein [Gammaproteobacteria bacterium]